MPVSYQGVVVVARKNKARVPDRAAAEPDRVSVAKKPARATKQPARSAEDLLHELQVHQFELEAQIEELRQSHIYLEKSRDQYIDFYDYAPVGYLTLNDQGMISEINLTGAALFGVARSKLLKQRLAHFVASEDRDRLHRHFQAVLNHDEKQNCEMLFKRGDGSSFYAQLDCLKITKVGGKAEVRIVLTDITDRKRKDETLREKEEFFRMIAENTEDFIAVLDLTGRRLYNNPTYARFFGDIERIKGTDSFAEIHPDDREHVKRVFREIVRSGIGLRTDFRFLLPDGCIRHMESRGGLIRNSKGEASRVVVVSRDITERKLAEEKIQNLAFHDVLTGLPNRRLLNDRLIQTMAASKRSGHYAALMFIDLDNFKPLNDRHGHAAGDLLLEEVARRITGCVREVDTVSRFGGDEFVVLLSELDIDKAKSVVEAGIVAEKIRVALAEPYVLTIQPQGKAGITVTHHCTSSIGVEMFIDHEISTDDILKRADLAMYQAKNGGRNAIRLFDSPLQMRSG
jgi:diguanylate cyclase (GGDEF)-like protein/PAS domain S-box-containing protein